MKFKGKENWTVLLSNGFNVYWELRKKPRPMPPQDRRWLNDPSHTE